LARWYELSAFGGTCLYLSVRKDGIEKDYVYECCYVVCGKGTGFMFFPNILTKFFCNSYALNKLDNSQLNSETLLLIEVYVVFC